MKAFVVDASVAAKWFPPLDQEPLSAEAQVLLERWKNGEIRLVAPDFILVEVANILWKSVRSGRCSASEAASALAQFRSQDLPLVSASTLIDRALRIAIDHARTAYDSLYISLALDSGTELVTADEKLANAVAARLPVKWLGAI